MMEKYNQKVNELSKVVGIAIDAFSKFPPKNWNENHIENIIATYKNFQINILNPEPQYKNLNSLKYLENDIFTYFQEGAGKTVDYFWENIKNENFPYKRENKVVKILKRKKISNQIEYDFVKDIIIPYKQEGLINITEANLLDDLLKEYEQKK